MSTAVIQAIIGIGSAVAGSVTSAVLMKKSKPQAMEDQPKEVKVDDEEALRRAQDMARKRKGYTANMLSDQTTTTAGSVGTKTALGQ